ncbi:dyslexia-associated protein KIAA0319 homolog isoform X2 [Oryzias latipes]|uniref:dyslexia-associated protein KIAA0319 homolog isoform X2 n=1 Tax=Oryzias latipes TaxID=8090 RepID=UPI000CE27394|nr:dyslexia-associated protein KIAA0319 homolog isoform X2 [Oryzias latipes]
MRGGTAVLLLGCLTAAVAPQCWQGATFSEAVVSPVVEGSGVVRVPGVASLRRCVAAGCDLPGYDLAWLFRGRCYVLSCQQREDCRPQERPGADSVLVFLRRGPSPSLRRGSSYGSRWRPLLPSSEHGGDLQGLPLLDGPRAALPLLDGPRAALPLLDGPRDLGPLDPTVLDVEYPEESQDQDGIGPETSPLPTRDGFNQSESGSHPTQTRAGRIRTEDRTGTEPAGIRTEPDGTKPAEPVTDSTQRLNGSGPQPPGLHESISTEQLGPPPSGSVGSPVEPAFTSSTAGAIAANSPQPAAGASTLLQAPPTQVHDVTPVPASAATPPSASSSHSDGSDPGPVAVAGPDRRLVLPLSSVLLNGSSSTGTGGRAVSSFRWEAVSGPPGFLLQNADRAVATVTSVQPGRYVFRLTVSDQEGATDSASLTVRVQEASSPPPVAHASGSHTLTLPNNSLVLRGSVSDGDQSRVHFLWTRDPQSPAAGVVLFGSRTQPSLFLADLVEGTYLFQLKVTDAQGRSSVAMATVEVRPEPAGGEQVELEMLVPVSQVSVLQRDTVVQQLAALIRVPNSDVHVRALEGRSQLSTVLRFSVGGLSGPVPAPRLVALLRTHLLRQRSSYLLFRALRVDAVVCFLSCSGRGQCDPITRQCGCDPFWTENLVRRYLGDGESNCGKTVVCMRLGLSIIFIMGLTLLLLRVEGPVRHPEQLHLHHLHPDSGLDLHVLQEVSPTDPTGPERSEHDPPLSCCRRRSQARKRAKYAVLNDMDEQERLELRPRFSVKHRSTEHNCSLMMSESELDSDQDAAFSEGWRLRSRSRAAACSREAFG